MGLRSMLLLVLAVVPLSVVANCVNKPGITGIGPFINECLHPSVYHREVAPPGNEPIKVEVQFDFRHLNHVNQINGFVSIGGYFRQWWKDERLAYNSSLTQRIKLTTDEAVWYPDIFIENHIDFDNPSEGWASTKLLHIFPDGSVYKSEMASMTIKCTLRFSRLPFDVQHCKLVSASYSKNTSDMRVCARDGTVGPGTSGKAVVGRKMRSVAWEVMDGTDFEMPGYVYSRTLDVGGTFDYLEMPFHFARFAGYYRTLVLIPSYIFLGITYTGFYLSPKAIPARATVAVIPLLIMITLMNNVYKSLPQSAENMWLVSFLLVGLVFALFAVIEFGIVQLLLEKEARAQKNLERLQSILPAVKKIRKKARIKRLKTGNLMSKINEEGLASLAAEVQQEGEEPARKADEEPARKTEETPPLSPSNNEGTEVKEADLLGLNYIASIFAKHDFDGSNQLSSKEVCTALSYFNIWLCKKTTAISMCMFLRDSGEETPENEDEAMMEFGMFMEFLIQINHYLLKAQTTTNLYYRFLQNPPSVFCDIVCRFAFPACLIVVNIIMLAVA